MFHEIKVEGREVKKAPGDRFVKGSVGVDFVRVSFDSEWDGMPVKATFSNGEAVKTEALTDGECAVPWEVLQEAGLLRVAFSASADGREIVTERMALPYQVEECGETDGASTHAHGLEMFAALVSRSAHSFAAEGVSSVAPYVFRYYSTLQSVDFPRAESVGMYAFSRCSGLARAAFGRVENISACSFEYCEKLDALILGGESVCALANSNAFTGTPIASGAGFVYVPDALIDDYKSAANWSAYAAQIKPISELEV